MDDKKKILKNILIVLLIILLLPLISCSILKISEKTDSTAPATSATIAESTSEANSATSLTTEEKQTLSEKPDEAAFKEYFTELGLGKLPENGKLPLDLKKGDNVFVSNGKDQIVIYGNLLKDTKLSNAIYDVNAKKNIREKTELPMIIKKGGYAGSEPVNIPAGKYEYKIWVDSKLAGVFPFEVKP